MLAHVLIHNPVSGGGGGGGNPINVSPSAKIVCMENIGFVYPAMSMMVIGSFASYTKTKSVESAV